jgi:hypothetical protein
MDTPAFPRPFSIDDVDPDISYPAHVGMTLRKYAAIKLKVPNSGNEELDAMIRESLRNDFAAKAMPWVAEDLPAMDGCFYTKVAIISYKLADAMLRERL